MRPVSAALVLLAWTVLATPAWGADVDGPGIGEKPFTVPAPEKTDEKPGAKPAETPPPPEPPKKPVSPAAAARAEKQLADLEQRLMTVLGEEMDVQVAVNSAEIRANQTVKDPAAASEELSKGHQTPQLREYAKIMRACLQQLAATEAKYAAIDSALRALQRDSAAADLKDRIKLLEQRVLPKHRTSQIKVGDFQAKAGDVKGAIATYNIVVQSLSPQDETERRNVKEKIVGVYDKAGDFKNALSTMKSVYDAIPEEHKYDDLNVQLKLASFYERTNDFANALQLYEDVQKHLKAGQTVGGLAEAIARCQEKVGSGAKKTGPKTH